FAEDSIARTWNGWSWSLTFSPALRSRAGGTFPELSSSSGEPRPARSISSSDFFRGAPRDAQRSSARWPNPAVGLAGGGFQAPHYYVFSKLSRLPGKSRALAKTGDRVRTKRHQRRLGEP